MAEVDFELVDARSASIGTTGTGFLSGLELPVPVGLFLVLKTSLKRPTGDGERRALEGGGPRPVLLRASGGADSRPWRLKFGTLEVRGDRLDGGVSEGCGICSSGR